MKKYFAIVPFYKENTEEFFENQISDLSNKNEIRDFCTIEKAIKYAEKLFKEDRRYVIKMVKIFKTTYCYDMRRFYQCTVERNSQTLLIANKL
jgi:hypothetical protein